MESNASHMITHDEGMLPLVSAYGKRLTEPSDILYTVTKVWQGN